MNNYLALTDGDGAPPATILISIPTTDGESGAELSLTQVANGYMGSVTLHSSWQTTYIDHPPQTGVANTTHSPVNIQ